jgi:hypothetical protein
MLFSTGMPSHNDHLMRPIHGMKIRSIGKGFQNEKQYLYFLKQVSWSPASLGQFQPYQTADITNRLYFCKSVA